MWCLWNPNHNQVNRIPVRLNRRGHRTGKCPQELGEDLERRSRLTNLSRTSAGTLTQSIFVWLARLAAAYGTKLKGTNADEYPGLRKAVDLIAQVLDPPVAQQARDPLPCRLAETAFAASYFLKEFDLVPARVSA